MPMPRHLGYTVSIGPCAHFPYRTEVYAMPQELSVLRSENKYLLSYPDALSLRRRLDALLTRDGHGGPDGYLVRSLYFDSANHIDFATKLVGTERRKKVRLRVYSPDSPTCKLELKEKRGDLQHKRSLLLTRAEGQRLSRGELDVLTPHLARSESAAILYKTMALGAYRPAALVEYDRIAYVYPRYDTRITFDLRVRSNEARFDLFDSHPCYTPILNEQVILEVKYDRVLMGFISELLRPYCLIRTSVSKYCIGRRLFYDILY